MIGTVKRAKTRKEELEALVEQGYALPRHVALIMDGNGRWAKRRGLPRVAGHREGVKSVREIVEAAGELKIDFITLYTFSKENWNRPAREVSTLMRLLVSTLRREIDELDRKNVRLQILGDMNDLPEFAAEGLQDGVNRLAHNTGLTLNLALSYGSRNEIVNAIKNIARQVQDGDVFVEEIDDQLVSRNMYTRNMPDPDLLIRTSGEQRISNFLLWQLAYSEIYLTDTLWPDFRKQAFYEALINFTGRERRFGMISEQVVKTA